MTIKDKKEVQNKIIEKMAASSNNVEKVLNEISKQSAAKQLAIGAVSGWATGFAAGKIGKFAAFAIGGSIILLEVAHENGYIKIDWNKVSNKVDQVTDRVEEAVTGEGPRWMDKAERYVDRKLDQAESVIKKKGKKAKRWYSALIGDENGAKLNEFHIFLGAFVGGVALGIATSSM